MKYKKDSFRWRIYLYNILLLTMVAIMGSMYFLLNKSTIDNYDSTFTTYNELNHFYDYVKDMNTTYEQYLTTQDKNLFQQIQQYHTKSVRTLEKVQDNLDNLERANTFTKLQDDLAQYKQALIPIQSDTMQAQQGVAHERFLTIMKSRGNYFEVLTEDMQSYKDLVNQNRIKLGWMSVLLVLFMLLWIMYFSTTMIRSITGPIETIIHNMKLIKKGEYDLTQISNTNEEMKLLCIALEDMAKSVSKNISYAQEKADLEKKVLEQENENLRKDELLAQGELRVLQNQINPHFLFNTLNMIYKKAYSEGAFETSEMMEKTSQLLRYALNNSGKVSSLHEEVKAIENYMYIQEKRFGERIRFVLDVKKEVENIPMPSMILQPLVENAVAHGLKDSMEDGEVIVSAAMDGKEIVISVIDNGQGMPTADLEKLILNEYRMRDDEREHIGLYNVSRRLKMFYGDKVRIIINSEVDCGFEFVIKILKEVE